MKKNEENTTGILISIINRYGSMYINRRLKSHNITSGQHAYLLYINKHNGCKQEDIASHFKVDKANITRAVKILSQNKYIEKKPNENDSRCNKLYMLKNGKRLVNKIKEILKDWNELLMKGIREEEKFILIKNLEIMSNNAEKSLKNFSQ